MLVFDPMSNVFLDSLLRGKVAFVTGGGSGIGQRIAERFAEHGAKVILAGRNAERLQAAVSSIQNAGGTADAAPLDVRDFAAIEAAMDQLGQRHGELDIVVCAAAGNFPAPLKLLSPNGFKSVVDIDLQGTFNTCRAAYAYLRKPGASILNISANQAAVPFALQAHVCAAKAGVEMLTKTIALEWGPEGVRANCITPGPTDDTEGMRRLAPSQAMRSHVELGVPLRRLGTKDEIADLALFLASDAASYINGAILLCDGGASLCRQDLPVDPTRATPR